MGNEFIIRKGIRSLGGVILPYVEINSEYIVKQSDYLIDAKSGNFDVFLPNASEIEGKIFILKNSGDENITIIPTSNQTIDNYENIELSTYDSIQIISDGSNWIVFGSDGASGTSGTSGTSGLGSIDNNINNYVITGTGTSGELNGEENFRFDGSKLMITGDTEITGTLTASSKSFDIPHPTKVGFRLRYGVLEGPEHGVYFRGRSKGNLIFLPEYWSNLVHLDSITVHLTPIGQVDGVLYVEEILNDRIYVRSTGDKIDYYYIVHAERKDVDRVLLEYEG
jgi:hypothetical protein